MTLSVESFRQQLPECKRLFVAYSGGLDSAVLLHLLVEIRTELAEIIVLHVDHSLQPESSAWAAHCVEQSKALGLQCRVLKVEVVVSDQGLEAAAREARYAAFAAELGPGDCLLTAHHADDQIETFLLRLLRGSGPAGLAAMSSKRSLGKGWLCRPLLVYDRKTLENWAKTQQLQWIDDPSNADAQFDRNWLRHELLPQLTKRWPKVKTKLARSTRHAAEADALLTQLAELDLDAAKLPEPEQLSWPVLAALDPAKLRNALRYWIRRNGYLPPPEARLDEALRVFSEAGEDRNPCVAWRGAELRRYRDCLYLMEPLQDIPENWSAEWDGLEPLQLPGELGVLRLEGVTNPAITYTVCFRQGGETVRLKGQQHALKNWFQENSIPPWIRGRMPLLYDKDVLLAVADRWQTEDAGLTTVVWQKA